MPAGIKKYSPSCSVSMVSYVYGDTVQSVHYLLDPTEVQHHVVSYREPRQVLQRLDRQLRTSVRERIVQLALSQARYLYQGVPWYSEQATIGLADHDRV